MVRPFHCCYVTGLRAFLSPRQGRSQCREVRRPHKPLYFNSWDRLGSLKDGFVLCNGKEDNRLSNLNQAVPYTF
jgi:hypothetical protein